MAAWAVMIVEDVNVAPPGRCCSTSQVRRERCWTESVRISVRLLQGVYDTFTERTEPAPWVLCVCVCVRLTCMSVCVYVVCLCVYCIYIMGFVHLCVCVCLWMCGVFMWYMCPVCVCVAHLYFLCVFVWCVSIVCVRVIHQNNVHMCVVHLYCVIGRLIEK